MRRLLLLIMGCLIVPASGSAVAAGDGKWKFGTEFDLVQFLNHGYYISAIAGKRRLRGRVVRTELTTPSFVTDDEFEDNDLSVWAVIADVYFKDGFSPWLCKSSFGVVSASRYHVEELPRLVALDRSRFSVSLDNVWIDLLDCLDGRSAGRSGVRVSEGAS